MRPREKVSQQEFSVDTTLSPEAIRKAGQRALEAGKRFMTNTIVEREVADTAIGYVIKGPGGIVEQMAITVAWKDLGNGMRRVMMEVGDFKTAQQAIMFIPVAPKTVPALGSLKRFATALRQELA